MCAASAGTAVRSAPRAERLPRLLYALAACMACASVGLAWWSWQSGQRYRDQLLRAAGVQAEVLARDFGEDFRETSDTSVRRTLGPALYERRVWSARSADSLLALAKRAPALRNVVRASFLWSSRTPTRVVWRGERPQHADAVIAQIARFVSRSAPGSLHTTVFKSDTAGRETFASSFFRWYERGGAEVLGFIGDPRGFAESQMRPVTRRVATRRLGDAADDIVAWRVISPGGDTVLSIGSARPDDVEQTVAFWRPRFMPDSTDIDANFLAESSPRRAVSATAGRPSARTTPYLLSVRVNPRRMAQVLYGGDVSPALSVGALLALSLMLTGVTAVLARRLAAHAREREQFATTIAHELRTPLTQMLLHAETLQLDRAAPNTRQHAARVVVRETRRLIHLVENALLFVRGKRSAMQFDARSAALAPIVAEALDGLEPVCAQSLARVDRKLDPEVSARVDSGAVHQIVVNLVDNALHFGPPGQTITVRVLAAGDRVRLSVEDEGPGIAAADRTRVFEPFVRDPQHGGNGIGLAIVRQLAELHDGRAWIEDGAAGGARVVVDLGATVPAERANAASPDARPVR